MENKHHHTSTKDLQQDCIVKSIKNKGSKRILLLEPIKVQCPGCNGKCARMLKPVELIEFEYDKDDIKAGDKVTILLDNLYLIKMVCLAFGIPLFALIVLLLVLQTLNFTEEKQILTACLTLVVVFVLQAKFIKFEKRFSIRKNDAE